MNTKQMTKILAGALSLSLLVSPITFANSPLKKEETLYQSIDQEGNVLSSSVSVWLHDDDGLQNVSDPTNLKNIENLKSDDAINLKDGKLVWNTKSKDIYYSGESEKKLPIAISSKITLDGKEVKKETAKNMNGHLVIELSFKNKDFDQKSGLYRPYTVASALIFDNQKVKNISSDSSTLINDGNRTIVSGVFLPGLRENIEKSIEDLSMDLTEEITDELKIEADVSDYDFEELLFIITPKLPDLSDLSSFDGSDEIKDALNELNDNGQKLEIGRAHV